jgi:hypothetical protein
LFFTQASKEVSVAQTKLLQGRKYMRQIRARGAEIFIIALLVFLICQRVWGLGIVNHDDAIWALSAHRGGPDVSLDMAIQQGRLWALPIGHLMLYALARQGTNYGEILRLGSFVVFFALFYITAAIYCGTRIATTAALLFLALFELRWDGSILTAYPLLIWPSASVFLSSVLFARSYIRRGGALAFSISVVLFWISLFNNESITFTFIILFAVFIIVSEFQAGLCSLFPWPPSGRAIRLSVGASIAVSCYAVPAVLWLRLHPSTYDGHVIAPFNLQRIAITLLHFLTNSSVVHDFIEPYSVNIFDAPTQSTSVMEYTPLDSARTILTSSAAISVALLVTGSLWKALALQKENESPRSAIPIALVIGLIVAVAPLAPVAMTAKYQNSVMEFGVRAHYFSILAHFGLSLIVSALIITLLNTLQRIPYAATAAVLLIAICIGGLAAVAFRTNDAIVSDLRPEASRWRVLARVLGAMAKLDDKADVVLAPRFASGSWFAKVPQNYWENYAKAHYGRRVQFRTGNASTEDIKRGLIAVDYLNVEEDHSLITTIADVERKDGITQPRAERIVVDIERPTTSRLADYWLSYMDGSGSFIQRRLGDLPPYEGADGLRYVMSIDASLASVSVRRGSSVGPQDVDCAGASVLSRNMEFGRSAARKEGACFAGPFLVDGWSSPEDQCVWSDGGTAHLSIPMPPEATGDVDLTFTVSSFVGFGFTKGEQRVDAIVGGRTVASWRWDGAAALSNSVLRVPAELRGPSGQVDFTFSIRDPIRPKDTGINPQDDRALGLLLCAITAKIHN